MTVVIVEDDPMMCRALSRALRALETPLLIAGTVEGALEHIEQSGVHVLLTDFSLGEGEDISQLLEKVRESHPRCEIFLMTGHDLPMIPLDRNLYDEYIQKPFSLRDLRGMIERSLRQASAS